MNSWISNMFLALLGTGFLGLAGDPLIESSPEDVGLPGITKPSLQAVIHPNIAGVVQEILVQEGEFVRADTPLIRMDDRVALANLAAAEVAAAQLGPLDLARAELKAAQQHLQRLESVTDVRAVAGQDFEIAHAAVGKARANLSTAEGTLRLAKERLAIEQEQVSQLTLRAPFDGIVHHIKANIGERLQENQNLLEIVNTTTLKVELYVPSAMLEKLQIGKVYPLQTAFRGLQVVDAKLTAIAPVIDPSTDTIRCVFEIENAGNKLPAGFLVHFRDN
ncbi:MAG: efflux RND transporter periplasmic adaptor subunit [Planctomycetota bacterium]|jgi:RND family efflux transporter MFP subunit